MRIGRILCSGIDGFSCSRTGGFLVRDFHQEMRSDLSPYSYAQGSSRGKEGPFCLTALLCPFTQYLGGSWALSPRLSDLDRCLVLTESMRVYGLSTSLPDAVYWGSSNLTV